MCTILRQVYRYVVDFVVVFVLKFLGPSSLNRVSSSAASVGYKRQGHTLARTSWEAHWPVRLNAQARTVQLGLRVAAHDGPRAPELQPDPGSQGQPPARQLVLLRAPAPSQKL